MYLKNAACLSLRLSLRDMQWPQEGWRQLEGKQEPDDSAPAVRSGGFWGALASQANSGGKLSLGCFAPLCSVVSSGQEPCREAARRLQLSGSWEGGGVQPPSP